MSSEHRTNLEQLTTITLALTRTQDTSINYTYMASPLSLKSEIQPPNTLCPHTKSRKNQSCTEIKQKIPTTSQLIIPTSNPPNNHPPTSSTNTVIHTNYDIQHDPTIGKQIHAIINTKPQHVKMNGEPKPSEDPTNDNRIQHHTLPPPNGRKNLNYLHKQHSFGPQHIPIQQIHTK